MGKILDHKPGDESTEHFVMEAAEITRSPIHASMVDGEILHGFRYERARSDRDLRRKLKPLRVALLCLASELGNSREHHAFILALLQKPDAPKSVFTLDFRGRGRSVQAVCTGTDASTDATDLISFCDAMGLHHVDVVVNGRGISALMLASPSRPGMVRKLVLNDAAPEFDSVGIAKLAALGKRTRSPGNWEEAVNALKQTSAGQFPDYNDEEWMQSAQVQWRDNNGIPAPDFSPDLVRASGNANMDEKLPVFWKEFRLFQNKPVLIVHGERSLLVNAGVLEKIKKLLPNVQVEHATGQGHLPQLQRDGLFATVLDFLGK